MKTALWLLLAFAVVIAAVLDDFPRAMLVDAGDPVLNWPNAGGKPWPPVRPVGDSLRDVVRESEGGTMPSQEEFQGRGLGSAQQQPGDAVMPPQAESPTPPRAPDAGGPGRVLPEERRLTAWAFGVWGADGGLRSGGMFADPDECLIERTRGQSRYPRLTFGPCVEIVHGRETL